MTDAEKIAAFDHLAAALINRYHDGRYAWLCTTPCGGPSRDTPGEALADLIAWAERESKRKGKPTLTQLAIIEERGAVG